MKRCLLLLLMLTSLSGSALAYDIEGEIIGGEGFPLRYVFAVPMSLDTFFVTIAIPFINTYGLNNLDEGNYVLFAYQDLNTSITPDLDEPRGFYGGEVPQLFNLISDSSGVDIEISPPATGGFSGTIDYAGTNTGPTFVHGFYNSSFADTMHAIGLVFNNTGNGTYAAVVDSFTTYYAYAFMDLNGNLLPDPDEPYGVYGGETPDPIEVEETSFPEGINITLVDRNIPVSPRPDLPVGFDIEAVYPNPFNSLANVLFTLSRSADVRVILYDILGEEVKLLSSGTFPAGRHTVSIDGGTLPSGLYFVKLEADGPAVTKKLLLLK